MSRTASLFSKAAAVAVALLWLPACSLIPWIGDDGAENTGVRKIGIIPFAYEDASTSRPCDLCPREVEMQRTSRQSAMLTTAFFFEELTHYPRFDAVEIRQFDRLIDHSMADAVELFRVMDDVDVVLTGAVLDLREREGNPNKPTHAAGATLYAALLEVDGGDVLWQGTFDEDQKDAGLFRATYRELVRGDNQEWLTAAEFAHRGARELVRRMVKEID